MWFFLAAVALISFIYLKGIKPYQYWKNKGVKQGFVVPFFGDAWVRIFKNISFAEGVQWRYNKISGVRYIGSYLFSTPALIIKCPNLIKQIGVKDFDNFLNHRNFFSENSDLLWSKNLFALKGQEWKNMRSTVSPSFTTSKMKGMFHLISYIGENFSQYFIDKGEDLIDLELKDSFTRYTTDVIASLAFGVQCNSMKDRTNEFFLMGTEATSFNKFRNRVKFIIMALFPIVRKMWNFSMFSKEVADFFYSIVSETIKYREKENVNRSDMIGLLLDARKGLDKEEEKIEDAGFAAVEEHFNAKNSKLRMKLTDADITSQAFIFFLAGFETVSNEICFFSYELAVNPDVQERLRKEIDETRAKHETLNYEAVAKMTYLDMCLSETLRKWPTIVSTDRQCTKPYILKPERPDEPVLQLIVDDSITIPIFPIHRDPEYYPDPEKFDPERFSNENKDKIRPYTYLPFGVGPRNCIGSRFALLEMKVVFYYLLTHFEIVPVEKTVIPLQISKGSFNLSVDRDFCVGLKRRNV